MYQANVSFAKIVATPTQSAWSQAYNAGSLFAVLSLTTGNSDLSLTTIGKDIINNLEAEFFTLETKSLSSIQQAVQTSISEFPADLELSLTLSYVKEDVLYVVVCGIGTVLMKRDHTFATLLTSDKATTEIISASGYIKQHDIIILETKQFAELVSLPNIKEATDLQLPNDIAEMLSPTIHNAENGGASAIVLSITGVPKSLTDDHASPSITEQPVEKREEYATYEKSKIIEDSTKTSFFNHIAHRFSRLFAKLKRNSQKKTLGLFLLALVFFSLLTYTILTTVQSQQKQRLKNDFSQIYKEINQKYNDAIGIKVLNPAQAREDLQAAKEELIKKLARFPDDSEEKKVLVTLEQKIDTELASTSQAHSIQVEKVDQKKVPLFETFLHTKNSIAVAEDEDFIYVLTKQDIISRNKITKKEVSIVKNNAYWESAISLQAYNGNLYVFDSAKGILKFVPAGNGYTKSSYFQNTTPNLSQAVNMAVDGSVWLLFSDGTIKKYTKGNLDTFSLKGLDTSLNKAKSIFTDNNTTNLYILDAVNNRIVQFSKEGTYKAQYTTPELKEAKLLFVNESDKKVYFLKNREVLVFTLP